MKRREFIGLAAAGAAGLAWPATVHSHPMSTRATPPLLAVLRDEHVVREVGKRYRDIVPTENDARFLTQAILPEPGATAPAAICAQMNARVQCDFDSGQTVTLNGWILSVTEARQCALYSLAPV